MTTRKITSDARAYLSRSPWISFYRSSDTTADEWALMLRVFNGEDPWAEERGPHTQRLMQEELDRYVARELARREKQNATRL